MAAWPPRTGVANVYEGVIIARSSGEIEIALTLSATEASNRPILMARARATSLPAVVEVRTRSTTARSRAATGWRRGSRTIPGSRSSRRFHRRRRGPARARARPRRRRAPSVAAASVAAKSRTANSRAAHPIPSSPLRPSAVLRRTRVMAGKHAPTSSRLSAPLYEQPRSRARPPALETEVGTRMLAIVAGRKHRAVARLKVFQLAAEGARPRDDASSARAGFGAGLAEE